MTVRGPCDHRTNCFGTNDHLQSCEFREIIARPPHDSLTTFLRDPGLRSFFLNCHHKSSLNKIVEATAPENPYGSRMAAVCFRTEVAR